MGMEVARDIRQLYRLFLRAVAQLWAVSRTSRRRRNFGGVELSATPEDTRRTIGCDQREGNGGMHAAIDPGDHRVASRVDAIPIAGVHLDQQELAKRVRKLRSETNRPFRLATASSNRLSSRRAML